MSHEPDLSEPEFEYDPQVGTIDLTQAALIARTAGRCGRCDVRVRGRTIKAHLKRLFSKLDVRNRAQAAALARIRILGESRSRSTPTDEQGNSRTRPNR